MKIVSSARKVMLQPQAGTPKVQFPPGAEINGYGAGNDSATVIVLNGTEEEPTWQGVSHETGVVLVNLVPEDVAETMLDLFEQGGQTNQALLTALLYAASLGHHDQYTSPLDFVESKLSPAGRMVGEKSGIVKRDDRDLVPVWREGSTFFVSTDGIRDVRSDILLDTYRMPDGSKIDLDAVPEGRPEGIED